MAIVWLVFLIVVEFYGVAMFKASKTHEGEFDFLCLIPFYAFFKISKKRVTFKIFTIPVKKCGCTVMLFAIIMLLSTAIMGWGANNFAEFPKKIGYINQIMAVPICISLLSVYLIIVKSSLKLLFEYRANFKFDWLACMLIVPIPFLLSGKRG